jgi:hypothetical protein
MNMTNAKIVGTRAARVQYRLPLLKRSRFRRAAPLRTPPE